MSNRQLGIEPYGFLESGNCPRQIAHCPQAKSQVIVSKHKFGIDLYSFLPYVNRPRQNRLRP